MSGDVDFCAEAKPLSPIKFKCVVKEKKVDLTPKVGPKWISRANDSLMCEWSNLSVIPEEDAATGA